MKPIRVIIITYRSYLKRAIPAEPAEEAIDFIIDNFDSIEELEIIEFESTDSNKKVIGFQLEYLDLIKHISGGKNG